MRKGFLKKLAAVVLTVVCTAGLSIPALAAGWKQDNKGWWYETEDGGYLTDDRRGSVSLFQQRNVGRNRICRLRTRRMDGEYLCESLVRSFRYRTGGSGIFL